MALSVETCVAEHIGDRQDQQDRVALVPHPVRRGMLLAVLADGMGGHTGGGIAAEQVIHKAGQNFLEFAPAEETPQELLRGMLEEAHVTIKLTRFTSETEPHSTACALVFQPGRVDWAHCGDSRVYHFSGGRLRARSVDHSYVNELVRRGEITEQVARTHPRRNVLLSCLGAEREPVISYGHAEQTQGGDAFLLCSDGLWAHFEDDELADALHRQPPRAAAQWLVEQARRRAAGRGDNISLVIVKLVQKN